MKYIDAELLRKEIEYLKAVHIGHAAITKETNAVDGLDAALQVIDSLQQEQQEVDLEKEIEKEWEELEKDYSPSALDKSHIIVSGLVGRKQFSRIAHHFYELCKNSK